MTMNNKDNKKIILYLMKKLGSGVEGKKKLMKLMFLLEHYDLSSDKLKSAGFLGNNFQIYYYGVFSTSIMRCVQELIDDKKIKDGFPLVLKETADVTLEPSIQKRIDGVLEKFGKKSGYYLEVKTLEMLNIKPHEKGQYFGEDIKNIISSSSN